MLFFTRQHQDVIVHRIIFYYTRKHDMSFKKITSKHFGYWELRRNGLKQWDMSAADFINLHIHKYKMTRKNAKIALNELIKSQCWYDQHGKYKVVKSVLRIGEGMVHDQVFDGTVWLCIRHQDGGHLRDWREYQQIKNDLVDPTREGVEIYPAEARVVDTDNLFNLFVLPQGITLPLGWASRDVSFDESPSQRKET